MIVKSLRQAVALAEQDPNTEFFAIVGISGKTVIVIDLSVLSNPVVGVCQSSGIRVVDCKFGSAPGGRCLRMRRAATSAEEPICGIEYTDRPEYLYTTRCEAEAALKERMSK
jgi:hypothetical protein